MKALDLHKILDALANATDMTRVQELIADARAAFPLPASARPRSNRLGRPPKYPWATTEVGGHFLYPANQLALSNLRQFLYRQRELYGRHFDWSYIQNDDDHVKVTRYR